MTRDEIVAFVDRLNGLEMGYLVEELMAETNQHKGLPKHPDFVYRLSKEWKGWADFLGKALADCSEEELTEMLSLEANPRRQKRIKSALLSRRSA